MRLVTALLSLPVLAGCRLTAPEPPAPWLLVPDVGQGHSIAVVQGDRAVVVDAGPQEQASMGRALRACGVSEIELFVLSHPDMDHSGGIDSLGLPVRRILHGALSPSDSTRVLSRCPEIPDGCAHGRSGWMRPVLLDLSIRVVGPADPALQPDPNSNSLVVEFRRDGRGLVLASGDLDTAGELGILDRVGHVDVVQLGHHGSAGSSHLRWLGALSPRIAIVQAGVGNRYGHPTAAALARAAAVGATVLRPSGGYLRVDL